VVVIVVMGLSPYMQLREVDVAALALAAMGHRRGTGPYVTGSHGTQEAERLPCLP
jgi:hypothetical protein